MNHLKLINLKHTSKNSELLQNIFKNSPEYFRNVSGAMARAGDGENVFKALPSNFKKENKHVLGIEFNATLIGVIDCLIGYPNEATAYIGLLLLSEEYHSIGLGKLSYNLLEDHLRTFPRIKKIRLAVVESNNQVLKYWEKMGFILTGEVKSYSNLLVESQSILMEKNCFD